MVKSILLAVLTLSGVASAGVRTVGNGGGFGEMKAYLAFQQMGSQIHICLALKTICKLTEVQRSLLDRVAKSLPSEDREAGLKFFNDPSLRRTVETEPRVGATIFLNSNILTKGTGVAETFSKISSFVLFALLRHQTGSAPSEELWELAQLVFAGFQENIITTAYNIDTHRILLHRLRFFETQSRRFLFESLLIEDEVKTYDLILTSGLSDLCPRGSDFATKIVSMSPGGRGELNLQVGWSCDSKSWGQASIFYHFRIDGRGLIVLPLQKTVRGVVRPAGLR
jgi:hypothetical protein